MKIGITSGAYFGSDENIDGLERMKKHGFDCMDYNYFINTEMPLFGCGESDFEKTLSVTREKINSHGIEIFQTHGPWRFPPRDFTEDDRAERFEKMARSVIGTRLLGAKLFVIHPIMPFGCDSDPDPELFLGMNLEFFSRLTKIGEENGVVICLENMPFKELSLSSPQKTLEAVKLINSPYMKMCLDTGHSIITGVQPGNAVREIGREYLACLHVHDNDGKFDLHKSPFTGVIDWADFSNALGEIGFEGVISLETDLSCNYNANVPPQLREYFEIGLARLAKSIADAV